MKSMFAVLMLLGITTGIKQSHRGSKLIDNLSETKAGISHTCDYSIKRIKAGPADYKTIVGSKIKFTDSSFPPDLD